MTDRVLVDTNILVYAYDADAGDKRSRARDVIDALWNDGTGVLATQVLAEFFVTITRKVKRPLSISSAKQIIEDYQAGWEVYPTTGSLVVKAISGVESHRLSFWDAMIWASAVINGVPTVYSEDMQDGQTIEAVLIKNPLAL